MVGQKKRIAADCSKRGCKKRGGRKALAPAGPCQAQEVDQRKKIAADCSERSCKKRGGKKALVPAGPCQAQEVDRRKKIAADCSERSCKKRGGKKALAPAGPCQGKAQVVGHTFQKITSMAHHTVTRIYSAMKKRNESTMISCEAGPVLVCPEFAKPADP